MATNEALAQMATDEALSQMATDKSAAMKTLMARMCLHHQCVFILTLNYELIDFTLLNLLFFYT